MGKLPRAAVATLFCLSWPLAADAQKTYTPKSFAPVNDVCDNFLRSLAARDGVMQAWKAWQEKEGRCNSLDKSAKAREVCRTQSAFGAAYERTHDEIRVGRERVKAAITSKTARSVLKTVSDMMIASGPLQSQIFEWKKESGRLADFLSDRPIFPALDDLVEKLPVTRFAVYDETLKAACRLGQVGK